MRHKRWLLGLINLLSLISIVTSQTQTRLLFHCDFEDDVNEWCGMTYGRTTNNMVNSDDYKWRIYSGETPTYRTDKGSTGPRGGHSNSNYYAYIEGSHPALQDMEATIETPVLTTDSGQVNSPVCVTFYYTMHGIHIGSLAIYTQVENDLSTRMYYNDLTLHGDQGTQWILFRESLPLYGKRRIGLRGIRGIDYKSDIAIDSINIYQGSCDQPGSIAFDIILDLPLFCGFETLDLCTMVQLNDDTQEWTHYSGRTPSQTTGPNSAYDGLYYIYLETSLPAKQGERAVIETPRLNLAGTRQSGDVCITFMYYMYGATVNTLQVYVRSRGAAAPIWRMVGEQGRRWNQADIRTNILDNDVIGFVAIVGANLTSDIALDALSIRECGIPTPSPYEPLPFSCTFEQEDFCGMTQSREDQIDWRIESGNTPTSGTGPDGAYRGSWYTYMDGNDGSMNPGDSAILETPEFDYDGAICVRFEYYMYGRDMGTLTVYTTGNAANPILNRAYDQGRRWIHAELNTRIRTGDQILFIASRGSGIESDIALDDIDIQKGLCNGRIVLPSDGMISCDMERMDVYGYDCRLLQDERNDHFNWEQGQARTPSGSHFDRRISGLLYPVTGPESADQGTHYLYIEASGKDRSQTARLIIEGDDISRSGPNCLRFSYNMNGFHTGSLMVTIRVGGGPRQKKWEIIGDQKQRWHNAAVDLNLDGVSEVAITATTKGKFSGDIALDYIRINRNRCYSYPSEYLWTCDFEVMTSMPTMCDMSQDTGDDFDWKLLRDTTPSRYTGPNRAFNGDYYIYIEASRPRRPRDSSVLCGPTTDYFGPACVMFHYNMYGFHIGELEMYTRSNSGNEFRHWVRRGQMGPSWRMANYTIDSLRGDEEICFRGTVGNEYSGDIALDNIKVARGGC